MEKKKRRMHPAAVLPIAFLVILALVLAGNFLVRGGEDLTSDAGPIARFLNVSLEGGEVVSDYDDHGGFHGDGIRRIEIQFPDDGFLNRIRDEWTPLPLNENLQQCADLVLCENGDNFLPEVKDGYSFFYDRHSESTDPRDDTDVHNRYSWNYTLAVYDCESRMLYFMEVDS